MTTMTWLCECEVTPQLSFFTIHVRDILFAVLDKAKINTIIYHVEKTIIVNRQNKLTTHLK